MPCFKGLAVSIHTPDGPLPEYSIQKQSRFSRITSYIPVPPAKVPADSLTNRPEQSTFAISITLLTPGLNIPYSQPKPNADDPFPRPRVVGGLPGVSGERGNYTSVIGPYIPLTTSPNETIAAYIYFDGRQKEEVATLLRRGEETWVNSRWVGVPESEGGGLAEREFLFREVGLERWLNGLDLEGKDAAAKIERRRQKMEKKRRKRKDTKGSDDEDSPNWAKKLESEKSILRYGADEHSPLEKLSDEDEMFSTDSDSDDDPVPEATGQIKVALFRVLASGEIKRGEYSPQFDAHDDDEDSGKGQGTADKTNGDTAGEADIDHTTSFAKPKSLDPKSISTQTVTGIDGPDRPYAVFTFLYRGEKQLQKMGILASPKTQEKPATIIAKRRSVQMDFANLKPLKAGGALGFSTFRDNESRSTSYGNGKKKDTKKAGEDAMDSDEDEDDEVVGKLEDVDSTDFTNTTLSPDDAKRQGELAEGVKKIKLKRQHSTDGINAPTSSAPMRRSPASNTPTAGSDTPPSTTNLSTTPPALLTSAAYDKPPETDADDFVVGSPLKRQRASLPGLDDEVMRKRFGLGLGLAAGVGEDLAPGLAPGPVDWAEREAKRADVKVEEEEEEL